MPTARELLEQADALMRRSRVGTGAGTATRPASPGTTPPAAGPTAGLPVSPRTIQREPIPPSVARTSLPVDPTESPAIVARVPARESVAAPPPPPEPPGIESGPEEETEFPLLIDAVDEVQAAVAGPLDDLVDDVPVLTDAVEEIDVGIVDEAARGVPSFWELTVRGETSVLGPAPDSIVVVPLAEVSPPAVPQAPPDHGGDPLGLDQPPLGYVGSEAASLVASEAGDPAGAVPLSTDDRDKNTDLAGPTEALTLQSEPFLPETTDFSRTEGPAPDRPEIEPSEPFPPETTDLSRTEGPAPDRPEIEPSEPFLPETTDLSRTEGPAPDRPEIEPSEPFLPETTDLSRTEGPAPERPEIEPSEPFPPETAESSRTVELEPELPESEPSDLFAPGTTGLARTDETGPDEWDEPRAETASPAQASTAETLYRKLAPVSESEQQRIREIAEEIGMQVLQRIDIFTDTTLRTQLGERLRPVVDRAAADLVAAINEHIGELLRVYISEAIEREIESWRNKDR